MSPHKHAMAQALKGLTTEQRAALIELGINRKAPMDAADDLSMRAVDVVRTFHSAIATMKAGYDTARGDR